MVERFEACRKITDHDDCRGQRGSFQRFQYVEMNGVQQHRSEVAPHHLDHVIKNVRKTP